MYQIAFTQQQLTGFTTPPQTPVGSFGGEGCSLMIDNQSKYGVGVYRDTVLMDLVKPYSHLVVPHQDDYTLAIETSVTSTLNQDYQYVAFKSIKGVKDYSLGSSNFSGVINSNITNSQINANITNSQVNANITNSQLNANVSGNVNANITNAQINASVSGNVNATITNSTLQTSVTGTVQANITNSNINATIQNASINSQVLNAMLATNTLVAFGSFDIPITNLAPNADTAIQTAYINMGFYDAVLIVAQSANGHGYNVSSANLYLKGNIATPASLALGTTLHSPSNGWLSAISYLSDANPFDTMQFTIRNNEAATIVSDTVHFNAYAFRSGTGSEAFPDRSGQYLYDNRGSKWVKEEANKDLMAIVNGTHTGQNVGFYNYNFKGILITVNVQLSATGSLTVKLNGNTNQGNTITILSETITTNGIYTYLVYPGANGTGSGLTAAVSGVLPPNFFINTSFSDTSTWTYGVDISLLN